MKRSFWFISFLLISVFNFANTAKNKNNDTIITITSTVSVDEIEVKRLVNEIFSTFSSKNFIQEFAKGMGEYSEDFTDTENRYFSKFVQDIMVKFLEKRSYNLKNIIVNGGQATAQIVVREPDFTMYKKENDDAIKNLDKRYENIEISQDEMIKIMVDEVTRIHNNILNKKDLKYREIPVDIKFIKENGNWIIDENTSEKTTDDIMGLDRIIYLLNN